MIACACAIGTLCTTTIVVVQHVSLRMTDRATGSDVTPKGVPSGARMRNRKLGGGGVPALFSGALTRNDVTRRAKKKNVNI